MKAVYYWSFRDNSLKRVSFVNDKVIVSDTKSDDLELVSICKKNNGKLVLFNSESKHCYVQLHYTILFKLPEYLPFIINPLTHNENGYVKPYQDLEILAAIIDYLKV